MKGKEMLSHKKKNFLNLSDSSRTVIVKFMLS